MYTFQRAHTPGSRVPSSVITNVRGAPNYNTHTAFHLFHDAEEGTSKQHRQQHDLQLLLPRTAALLQQQDLQLQQPAFRRSCRRVPASRTETTLGGAGRCRRGVGRRGVCSGRLSCPSPCPAPAPPAAATPRPLPRHHSAPAAAAAAPCCCLNGAPRGAGRCRSRVGAAAVCWGRALLPRPCPCPCRPPPRPPPRRLLLPLRRPRSGGCWLRAAADAPRPAACRATTRKRRTRRRPARRRRRPSSRRTRASRRTPRRPSRRPRRRPRARRRTGREFGDFVWPAPAERSAEDHSPDRRSMPGGS